MWLWVKAKQSQLMSENIRLQLAACHPRNPSTGSYHIPVSGDMIDMPICHYSLHVSLLYRYIYIYYIIHMYINPIYLARCLYLFVRPSIHPWLSAKVLMGCPQVSCWSHNDYLWRPSPPCTQMDMFGWSFGEPPKNGSTECTGAVWQCGCGARYSLLISWPLIDYFPNINIYIYII